MDAEPPQDVAADEAADDTNQEVDPEAEAGPFHDLARQESSKGSDKDCDDDTHSFMYLKVRIDN